MGELAGLKGFSAWSVYNKVAFNLVFLRQFVAKKRDFYSEVASIISLDDIDQMKSQLSQLTAGDFNLEFSISDCITAFKGADDDGRRLMLLEALNFSNMTDDEVLSLLSLHTDENNIPYSKANIGNIKIDVLMPLIIESLLMCSHVDVDLLIVTGEEMSMLDGKRVDVRAEAGDILANSPSVSVADLLALAIKKAFKGVAHG
jgi:hypothetical protein